MALAFVASVSSAIWLRAPIGHDEAVYGLRARDLLERGWSTTSGGYWTDYRAPGLSVTMSLVGRLGGLHVSSSRGVVMLLGLVIVIATWAIARRIAGDVAGVVAALILTASAGFTFTSSLLLADVPGAAFAMAAVVVYFIEIERGVLRWSFAIVPALAFAGTASRFGAPFMLAAGLVGVSLIALPGVYRARNWVLVAQSLVLAAAVALTCALVLFTDLLSLGDLSPIEANKRLVDGKGFDAASGFSDLRRVVNPWSGYVLPLWSRPVAVMAALGVVLAVVGACLKRIPLSAVVGIGVAAITSAAAIVVTVGLVVTNYLALTLPFWAVLIGLGFSWPIAALWEAVPRSGYWRTGLVTLAVVLAVPVVVDAARDTRASHRGLELSFDALRGASIAAGDALGEDCLLVTSYTPQVGYYSECRVATFNSSALETPLVEMLPQRIKVALQGDDEIGRMAVLVVERGKRQPPAEEFATSDALEPTRLFEFGADGDGRQHVWVQTIRPCVIELSC